MKKNLFKRGMAGLLSLVMCLTALVGIGTTTAYAAGERAEVYLVSFPRSGDANIDYSGTWGHPNLRYMNGWHSGESKYTTIRAMHSYDGNICYCIEPGVQQDTGDTYTSKDETFWDNLPSDINSTISPYDMKLFIGRIMQYGYTGPISTSWRWFKSEFLMPKKLTFRSTNTYYEMMKPGMEHKQKEVSKAND